MRRAACMLLLLAFSIPAAAAEAPSPGDDPLARHLFPPERVMGHAQEIGLDDAQRTAIRKEVQKAQSKLLDLDNASIPSRRALESLADNSYQDLLAKQDHNVWQLLVARAQAAKAR